MLPEWLATGSAGAVISGIVAVIVAAIGKRRTAPERRKDALDGFQQLTEALQEERDKADDRARQAREEKVAADATIATLEARIRVALAYVELLRTHVIRQEPPPPPDYPKGML